MEITLKTVKRMILDEVKKHYNSGMKELRYHSDCTQNIHRMGYQELRNRINDSETFDQLDEVIGQFYRMSLKEWIDSY